MFEYIDIERSFIKHSNINKQRFYPLATNSMIVFNYVNFPNSFFLSIDLFNNNFY